MILFILKISSIEFWPWGLGEKRSCFITGSILYCNKCSLYEREIWKTMVPIKFDWDKLAKDKLVKDNRTKVRTTNGVTEEVSWKRTHPSPPPTFENKEPVSTWVFFNRTDIVQLIYRQLKNQSIFEKEGQISRKATICLNVHVKLESR